MSAPANTQQPTEITGSGGPTSEDYLEFQVDRVGHPRRRLRLNGHSYTFGSGEGCSVRLEDPSLRKTHAILIRQQDRLLVRGYGIAILVNGIRVTEAWLEEHDNLQLGDYTLTLLRGIRREKPKTAAAASNRPASFADLQQSPFADTARHYVDLPRETPPTPPIARSRRKEGGTDSSRLSFADGMRLVSKPTPQFDASDYFTRSTPLSAHSQPPASREPAEDQQEAARLRRLERLQEESSRHAEAAMASSVASTHAVETLADKLESLFGQLTDNSERMRSEALQQELESAKAKHASQLDSFAQLTDRVSVLETAVDKANKEARLHREKHEQALDRIHQLETQLSEAIASHSERQASWEEETAGLRQSIDALNSQLQAAQQELSQQQKSALSWRKQLDDAIAGADQSATEHAEAIAAQIERQEALSAEHDRLVAELSEQHVQQNQALVAQHAATIESLLDEQERLKAQLDSDLAQHEEALAREQAERQQVLDAHAEQNQAAAARIAHLETELSDAVTKYKNHQTVWETEAKELNATIEQISSQLAISETKFGEQRERAEALQAELDLVPEADDQADDRAAQLSEEVRNADLRAAELNVELQNAQDRLAALRVEQATRQSTWQLEREELEYKISHQAAELSQFAGIRPAADPQEEATVANRLAARLQAEVNRLHQDQPTDAVEQPQQFASFPEAEDDPYLADSVEQTFAFPTEDVDVDAVTEPTFATSGFEPEMEQSAIEESFAEQGPSEEPVAEHPRTDWSDDAQEEAATTEPSYGESEPEAQLPSAAPDEEEPSSVFRSMTQPTDESDHHANLQVDDEPSDPSPAILEDEIANTYVAEDLPSQEEINHNTSTADDEAVGADSYATMAPHESDVDGDATTQTESPAVTESSFGSYDEAGWSDDDDDMVINSPIDDDEDVSPWGDDDDEVLGGLAAQMIGEFNRDAPQAGSFENLSESSTYDPTAMEFDASMSMGFALPTEAESPELSTEQDPPPPSSGISEAFPSVSLPQDGAAASEENETDDASFMGQTQVLPAGGYSAITPDQFDERDAEPVDSNTESSIDSSSSDESYRSEAPEETSLELQQDDIQDNASSEVAEEETAEEESYYGGYSDESENAEAPVSEPQKQAIRQREVPLYTPSQQPEPPQADLGSAGGSAHVEDEDDSIEAYMNRLLKRMHGDDSEPEPPAPSAPARQEPAASQPTLTSYEEVPETPAVEEVKQDVLLESEYVPRSSAPEHSGNLSAMRELANSSARQAIAKSVRNRQRSQSMLKLFLSGAFIMGSGTFAVLAQRQLMPYALAAGACVLLAIYWGLSGLKLLKGSGASAPRAASERRGDAAPAQQPVPTQEDDAP